MKQILYWVMTEDHDEDWFVVASSAEEAARYHEREEGYGEGDAFAEKVVDISSETEAEAGWPSRELLLELGAKFLREDEPRVVEIAGKKFTEGMLGSLIDGIVDDLFELRDGKRPNKTKKGSLH